MKIIRGFLSENFQFLEVKFSTYSQRRVFVMTAGNFKTKWNNWDRRINLSINVISVDSVNGPCGDMVYLSDSNPATTVTSPNYPRDYNGSHACTWLVKVKEKHKSELWEKSVWCLSEHKRLDQPLCLHRLFSTFTVQLPNRWIPTLENRKGLIRHNWNGLS